MSDCARCTAPAGDMFLCATCGVALRIDLGDVPALLGDLDITLCRLDRITDGGRRTGAEPPLPYKPQATEAAFILRNVLTAWVRTFNPNSRLASTVHLAQWLYAHVDRLRAHPDAGQAHDELTAAVREARRTIDRPNDQRQYLGRCDDNGCTEELYARPYRDVAVCPACEREYDVAERRAWMVKYSVEHLGTASEIAGFLRIYQITITPSAIRGYVARGRLEAKHHDQRGRPMYRIGDVIDVLNTRYTRQHAS